MFANSHCKSVLTVLKAYVAWQFLTFIMTLRPVSLYSFCSLWSFFLSTTWECSTFCSKDRYLHWRSFKTLLRLGPHPRLSYLTACLQLFSGLYFDPVNAQHLNSFWIPLYLYLLSVHREFGERSYRDTLLSQFSVGVVVPFLYHRLRINQQSY